MRIHATTTGLDPAALAPGADLTFRLDDAHGLDVPQGVLAHDYLGLEERRRVDTAAVQAVGRWRARCDEPLTVDGVCLPWITELDLILDVFLPTVTDALALDHALRRHSPSALVVHGDAATAHLVSQVAAEHGIDVRHEPARRDRARGPAPVRQSRLVRARRTLVTSALRLGVPSHVRRESVLFMSYWPLLGLLDRLLAGEGPRPAVWLEKLPARPARSLRAAARGGWVGLPGPLRRARAGRRTAAAVARVEAPTLDVEGLPLGPLLHERALAVVAEAGGDNLATAALFRRLFRRGRIRKVLVPYDSEPRMRLVVAMAREAGVPSLLVAHGAYPLRATVVDMQVSDEIALWSPAFGPTVWRWDRPLHVVGYPVAHELRPVRAYDGNGRARVLIPGPGTTRTTSLFDDRFLMRHYSSAIRAASRVVPGAQLVLRPHPTEGESVVPELTRRFPSLDLEVDAIPSIVDSLARSDLCVGTASTSTLQAALVGTPVVVLNVSGCEWCWPLGGHTAVPIATSEDELAAAIARWADGETLPGQQELLDALGANGDDATSRLITLLERPG